MSARWTVVFLALSCVTSSPGCGGSPCSDHQPHGMTLVINVDPALAEGTVTTTGACTPASCADPSDAGDSRCSRWRAEMTGSLRSQCDVTLTSPNGERREQQATVAIFCAETFVGAMHFEPSDPSAADAG